MFTGIIEATGEIVALASLEKGKRLTIAAPSLDFSDVALGDSIACSGVCLTVVELGPQRFGVDVSAETLGCTVGLDRRGMVNLEKALRMGERLGGHMVSGHVDGVGEVTRFEADGESHLLEIRAPRALARYVAPKGSITVNGVSLTVNRVDGELFQVNLIPHTVQVTTFRATLAGDPVNLEVDLVARYLERLLEGREAP